MVMLVVCSVDETVCRLALCSSSDTQFLAQRQLHNHSSLCCTAVRPLILPCFHFLPSTLTVYNIILMIYLGLSRIQSVIFIVLCRVYSFNVLFFFDIPVRTQMLLIINTIRSVS